MVQRRIPRPSELAPLLRPAPVRPRRRRTPAGPGGRASPTCGASRAGARPRAVFDYTDGAADGELSLQPRPATRSRRVEFTPDGPARRLRGRHRPRRPRAAVGAAVRVGPDRVHADDAHRGRAGGGVGRRRGRHPVHAVDDGHDDDRGHGGRRAGRAPAGSSSTCGATARSAKDLVAAGRRGRLRHADAHRRHPGRRRPAARRAQRADDPARAVAAHVRRRRPAPELVVRPAHHRAADVRQPGSPPAAPSPT